MSEPKVHLLDERRQGEATRPACSPPYTAEHKKHIGPGHRFFTVWLSEVTCGSCKRTKRYALLQQRMQQCGCWPCRRELRKIKP